MGKGGERGGNRAAGGGGVVFGPSGGGTKFCLSEGGKGGEIKDKTGKFSL